MDKEKVKFQVSKVELIDEMDDLKFASVKLYAFKSGENANHIIASEEVLRACGESIKECPLVCYYNPRTDDLAGHEEEELPVGFIPKDAKITYEKDESDGEVWIVVEAKIWTQYSGKVLELFSRNGDTKPVSVELYVLDSEKTQNGEIMKRFEFFAVTILGSFVKPAVRGANAQVTKYELLKQFSADKAEYEQTHYQEKEDSQLDKENEIKNTETEEVQVEEEMVELDEFEMPSYMERYELLYMGCKEEKYSEEGEDEPHSRYYLVDFSDSYVYCRDYADDGYKAMTYSIQEDKAIINFANPIKAYKKWIVQESTEKMYESDMNDDASIEMSKAELSINSEEDIHEYSLFAFKDDPLDKINEFLEKQSELEATITSMQELLDELSLEKEELAKENTSLNEFKSLAEEAKKKQLTKERDEKISYISKAIEDSDTTMPKEIFDEWIEKARNYSSNEEWAKYENIDIWANEFKSNAFDYVSPDSKNKKTTRYALPLDKEPLKNASFDGDPWHEIRQ